MGLSGVGRGGGRWLAGCVVVALLGGVWPLAGGVGAAPGRSVSDVSVSGGGDGVLVVSWEAPSEAPSDYRVAWAREDLDFLSYSAADEPERGNAYPAGDATSLQLEGLSAGATYKVLVRARYGPGGPGPWSGQATGDAGVKEDETEDGSAGATEDGSENSPEDGSAGGTEDSSTDGSTSGTDDEAEDGSEGETAGGTEGAGFAMEGVLEVGSSPYGDLTLLGFSTRSAGMGSFEVVSVGDPADERHIGGRGFVAGLMSARGALSFGGFGPFADAVVMMSPEMATPFVVEIGGRRYGSGEASLANGRGQSFRFWVWEDPCAVWADGDRLDVTFSPGPYAGAELGGADTTLASLSVDGAVLGQGFDSAVVDYSAAAEVGVAQVTVDALPADANACAVEISPADADPAAAGHQIDIDADDGAAVTVTVTAADQTSTASYTVTVAPPAGALPAAAAGMGLDGIDIDYQPDQKRYHATVPPAVRSTTVDVRTAPGTTARSVAYQPPDTAAPASAAPPTTRGWAAALLRRSLTRSSAGDGPSSQNADGTFDLAADRDTLVVTKVSTPGSERETLYTTRLRPTGAPYSQTRNSSTEPRLSALTVTPGTLNPAFAAATFSYDVAVAHNVATVTVAATAATGTTATVVAPDADPDTDGHQVALNPSTAQRSAQTAFIVLVTAGTKIDSYTVTVTRAAIPSDDATLSSLSVTPGTLSPAFDADTTSYTAAIGSSVTQVTVAAAKSDSGATVDINPDDADPNTAGHQVAVSATSTAVTVTVTAPDGVTTRTYTVTATQGSSAAALSSLAISPGVLSPAFDADTTSYTAVSASADGMVTVSASGSEAGADVVVSPPDADPDADGHQVRLDPESATRIAVAVTSSDGTTRRTYAIAATRVITGFEPIDFGLPESCPLRELSAGTWTARRSWDNAPRDPDFCHGSIPFGTSASLVGSYSVHASDFYRLVVRAAGEVELRLDSNIEAALAVYSTSGDTVAIDCRARDACPVVVDGARGHIKTTFEPGQYMVEVNNGVWATPNPKYDDNYRLGVWGARVVRPGVVYLSDLDISGVSLDGFEPGVFTYERNVAADVSQVTVTAVGERSDATAVVSVPDADPDTAGHQVALDADGETDITVHATALLMPGVTTSYTVTLTQVPGTTTPLSGTARLSALTLSDGTLTPPLAPAVSGYTANVANAISPITVTATPDGAGSRAVISPDDADLDTAGHQIDLPPGDSEITITVTAPDGETTRTYTLTVNPSNDARLAGLAVDGGGISLDPAFDAGTTAYSTTVASRVARVTVAAAARHRAASVDIAPDDADPDTDGHQIELPVGQTAVTVTVTVTAQDGTTRAYTLTVDRPQAAVVLVGLTLSGIDFAPAFDPEVTRYSAVVAADVAQTTVAAARANAGATVVITPDDADTATEGHQIDLAEGDITEVRVAVTAPDGTTTRVYTVDVTRPSGTELGWNRFNDIDLSDVPDLEKWHGSRRFLLGASGVWSDGETVWASYRYCQVRDYLPHQWQSVHSDSDDGCFGGMTQRNLYPWLRAFDATTGARKPSRDIDLAGELGDTWVVSGIWSDGTTMWVAAMFARRDLSVFAFDLATGERDTSKTLNGFHRGVVSDEGQRHRFQWPTGLWSDGTTMWLTGRYANTVFAWSLGSNSPDFDRYLGCSDCRREPGTWSLGDYQKKMGLWADGVTVWVTYDGDPGGLDNLVAYDMASGDRRPAMDFTAPKQVGNNAPRDIWSDGETMWVTDWRDRKAYAYNMPRRTYLSSLEVAGVDIGFAPHTGTYTAEVSASSVTVSAEAPDPRATIAYSVADADTAAAGHQVALTADTTEIIVTVTNGANTQTYTVTINR